MPVVYDATGLDRLTKKFQKLSKPPTPTLMITYMKIIADDNRRGVLAGLDRYGNPLAKLKYRPIAESQKKLTKAQKNNARGSGKFAGFGLHAAGVNNNLTSSEYRRLTGPPLAPRGAFSRVITNLGTRFGQTSAKTWEAVGYWNEVVNKKGNMFLHYHFNG